MASTADSSGGHAVYSGVVPTFNLTDFVFTRAGHNRNSEGVTIAEGTELRSFDDLAGTHSLITLEAQTAELASNAESGSYPSGRAPHDLVSIGTHPDQGKSAAKAMSALVKDFQLAKFHPFPGYTASGISPSGHKVICQLIGHPSSTISLVPDMPLYISKTDSEGYEAQRGSLINLKDIFKDQQVANHVLAAGGFDLKDGHGWTTRMTIDSKDSMGQDKGAVFLLPTSETRNIYHQDELITGVTLSDVPATELNQSLASREIHPRSVTYFSGASPAYEAKYHGGVDNWLGTVQADTPGGPAPAGTPEVNLDFDFGDVDFGDFDGDMDELFGGSPINLGSPPPAFH